MAQGNLAPAAPAGFRIEAIVGYDHGGVDGFHMNGILFGVGAGCDFAVSNSISLGVDAEVSDSTADKDGVSAGRDLYAGARVTFAVSPRANLYVKGGYTNARLKIEECCADNGDGFRLGLGGQYLISEKTYIGAEYRYSNYEADLERHQVALTLGTHF